MKKKILIVLASYYKEISDGLLKSALKNIPKSSEVKIITNNLSSLCIPRIAHKKSKNDT